MELIFIQDGQSFLINYRGKTIVNGVGKRPTYIYEVIKKNTQDGKRIGKAILYVDPDKMNEHSTDYLSGASKAERVSLNFNELVNYLAK